MSIFKKKESIKKEKNSIPGFYKGYDVKALRESPNHPDFYLVAEYDKLMKGGE